MKDRLQTWLSTVGYILLMPLGLLLWLIIGLPVMTYYWVKRVCFYLRNDGLFFLVVDGRHGWRDTINNNIIPVIPSEIKVFWYDSPQAWALRQDVYAQHNEKRPYIARCTKTGFRSISLHNDLLQYKGMSKRDEKIQSHFRSLVKGTLEQLSKGKHDGGSV